MTAPKSDRPAPAGQEPIELLGIPAGTPRFRPLQMPSAPFWVVLIGIIVASLVLVLSAHALIVFMIGAALSFFLVPVVNWLQSKGMPRIAAAILVVAVLVVVTLIGLTVITIILVEQGTAFLKALPSMIDQIQAELQTANLPTWLDQAVTAVEDTLQASAGAMDSGTVVLGLLQGLLGIVGVLFSFMLLPFFLFYLLKDQPKMAHTFYRKVPEPWKADVSRMITIFIEDFATYFKAEILVGAIMFCIISIGMAAIGFLVPDAHALVTYALLLGLAAFVFELIPQIGPILAYIPALLIALTISPIAVVAVSIYYFIAFNIEGSILVPTFQGRMISFSGASVLVIIIIGFALAGIIGAILALPIAAIVRDIFGLFFVRAQEFAGLPPTRDALPVAMLELAGPEPEAASGGATDGAPAAATADAAPSEAPAG
ncbi:MAG: AI-2E family transporter [Chloroflexota bacterium]